MKKIMLAAIIILMMSGTVLAHDPNYLNPVTIHRDPNNLMVTVTFYMANIDRNRRTDKYVPVSDAAIWSWINDPDFLREFQKLYLGFPRNVRNKIRVMTHQATWEEGRAIYNKRKAERKR